MYNALMQMDIFFSEKHRNPKAVALWVYLNFCAGYSDTNEITLTPASVKKFTGLSERELPYYNLSLQKAGYLTFAKPCSELTKYTMANLRERR